MIRLHPAVRLFAAAVLVLALTRCDEVVEPGDTPPVFAIAPVAVPEVLNVQAPPGGTLPRYDFAFRVTHPEGLGAIASVLLEIRDGAGQTVLSAALVDDGSVAQRDAIANDGVFTTSRSAAITAGPLTVTATATDAGGDTRTSQPVSAVAIANQAPQVLSISVPDTLPAGSAPLTLAATVQDSNEVADLAAVVVRLRSGGGTLAADTMALFDSPAPDSAIYTLAIDSSYAAGRQGGYRIQVVATDLSGTESDPVESDIFLENTAPRLSRPFVRDSLELPETGADTLHVKVTAGDAQSLADLDSVQFTVRLLGGNTSDPIAMFDDGNTGGVDNADITANDGRYSRVISLSSGNTPGTYVLEFLARDRVGNRAITVSDTLEVLPRPNSNGL